MKRGWAIKTLRTGGYVLTAWHTFLQLHRPDLAGLFALLRQLYRPGDQIERLNHD